MKIVVTASEMINEGNWDSYCEDKGINPWAVNEGLMDSDEEITLTVDEAEKYGLLKGMY